MGQNINVESRITTGVFSDKYIQSSYITMVRKYTWFTENAQGLYVKYIMHRVLIKLYSNIGGNCDDLED